MCSANKKSNTIRIILLLVVIIQVFLVSCNRAYNRPTGDRTKDSRSSELRGQQTNEFLDDDSSIILKEFKLPEGATVLREIPYEKDKLHRMDAYLPRKASEAPVVFMVHGGAWRVGDKASKSVVENKVIRWVSKGFIFVSINYRILPDAAPVEQAQDVAKALSVAQNKAEAWGGDPNKFILMGHSAGAHLVSLLAASPDKTYESGVLPWLGTISLDSAALDVVAIMKSKHLKFYDDAFGSDPAYWRKASPYYSVSGNSSDRMAPYLAVGSLRRNGSITQAHRFVEKVNLLNVRATVLEQDLSHRDINQLLGADNNYTIAVESFMGSLDKEVAKLLSR